MTAHQMARGNDDYRAFISRKMLQPRPAGLTQIPTLPEFLKPFQRDIVTWALRMGRCACFASTGLGKTAIQLAWADAIATATGRSVMILTPLAVAQQTVQEAAKFGVTGVGYARDQSEVTTRIVVTNYDRVEKFDMDQFVAIVLDESSRIKADDSKTRARLFLLCRDIEFRLCCSATPAPNDYQELGQHSQFLGVLTQKEMLATWFVHDGSNRATNIHNKGKKTTEWRLKRHAERDFWRWVSTWAAVVGHPRDIGYDEPGYDLPPLVKHQVTVPVDYQASQAAGMLFPMEALTLADQRAVARASIDARAAAAAGVIAREPGERWLVWCNLNDEADAVMRAVPGAIEVRGSDDADIKTDRLMRFANGDVGILVSKPSIAGWGLNFQVCARMIFLGLNNSYEAQFQAIRRCWRFGQTRDVHVWCIAAETEGAVVKNLVAKEAAADHMLAQMAEHMRDLVSRSLNGAEVRVFTAHNKVMEVPPWL